MSTTQITIIANEAIYTMDEDGLFTCEHLNTEIQEPCCNGSACLCRGLQGVYCYDCNNEDMTEQQAIELLGE